MEHSETKRKDIIAVASIMFALFSILSCKHEGPSNADLALFDDLGSAGIYYRNGELLDGISPSPHGAFKLRFNSIASSALDSTGELSIGNSFPNGSLIVKDLYSGGQITLHSVMKKDPGNANASNGWLWAEINTDGSATFSVERMGSGCISCHGGQVNRDFTRSFDLH